MTAKIIDGRAVAKELKQDIALKAGAHAQRTGKKPLLVALQVGHCPASKLYTDMQAKQAAEVGIAYELRTLEENATEQDVLLAINAINRDAEVTGLILQMPLPEGIDAHKMQLAISPEKDVEGIHPQNLGKLFFRKPQLAPCTPLAVVELLTRTCDQLAGKECVIVGHSEIVGKPIAMLLLGRKKDSPTITICNSRTRDLEFHVRKADILITAAGVSQGKWLRYKSAKQRGENPATPDISPLVPGDWVKPGAIIIDVATNRIPSQLDEAGEPILNDKGKPAMRTVGDVGFDQASEKASAITPVPGGVGPVTVAMLLRNILVNAQC